MEASPITVRTRMSQGAWEGWYYEFFVQRYLATHPTDKVVWWSKKTQGELDFDLRFPYREWFYGGVKSDDTSKDVQGNLKESIDFLIKEKGGRLWYIAIEFTLKKIPITITKLQNGGIPNLGNLIG